MREDHWWERVFNEASSNVNVQQSESGKIELDLLDKNGVEITNKSYSMKKLKESKGTLQYGSFLKSATLLANVGKEEAIEGHLSTGDIEIKPFLAISDEDLFKACKGRTAHKGARHGLNLSGKLQRIAEQEKILLEKMKNTQNRHEVFREPYTKKRKLKSLATLNSSKEETSDDTLPVYPDTDYILKATSKRKKLDKYTDRNLAARINEIGLDEPMDEPPKRQLKDEEGELQGRELTPIRKKKKKSKKMEQILQSISEIEPDQISRKKHKKNKRKLEDELVETPKTKKKSKRKLNKDGDDLIAMQLEPVVKIKKARLDNSCEASDDDVVARLNAETSISYKRSLKHNKRSKPSQKDKRKDKRKVDKVASILAEKL